MTIYNMAALDKASVDMKTLSSNFSDIASGCDCPIDGATLTSEIQNRFPLVTWLLGTEMSATARRRFNLQYVAKDENVWKMKVPGNVWTALPTNSNEECCWHPFDFAKCCGDVPLHLLCLKDCDSIMDSLVMRDINITAKEALAGISNKGEKLATVEKRIARMSLAFYTAYTAILGMDTVYTNILKPFHGLLAVMENPAIISISGANILAGFKQLGCRLAVLGTANHVIAVNPLIYRSIESVVTPGQNGELPAGWTKTNGELRYMGIRFIQDKLVPVDMEAGTGEAWVLAGDSVGLFLASDILVTDNFIKEGFSFDNDACGTECTYYYNYGSAFGNNSNRLARIVNIPIQNECTDVLSDIAGMIHPETLIPNGAAA